jgi:cytosine/adenosine deaminase-related metal-dependent hydrolase
MLLNNCHLLNGSRPVNIAIEGEKISSIGNSVKHDLKIHFENAMVLPGLINSHDHLDFNCYSPLGKEKYNNYTEWGHHIHKAYKKNIAAVLKIPKQLRTAWGMYKNLLAGVTTVVNHGAYLEMEHPLINIYQDSQNLHSIAFEKRWKWKLNNPALKYIACVIHTGEGVDERSHEEIDELIKFNLLNRKLIGIHGVAMDAVQAKKFKGVIWCPESNRLLLDRHADIKKLYDNTILAIGTDSTLTGNWNIWRHMRLARILNLVTDQQLFDMVTSSPAKLWDINRGSLLPGKDADIIVVKIKSRPTWDSFYSIDPEDILMVMHKGKIRLIDEEISDQFSHTSFYKIKTGQRIKYVEGDLPALMGAIKKYYPQMVFPIESYASAKILQDDPGC